MNEGVIERTRWHKQYAQKPEVKLRKAREARERWRDPNERPKLEARIIARRAIKAGTIIRGPCEQCGDEKSQMHHDDYSKPLDVRWFCRPCHTKLHKGEKLQTHCKRGHEMSGNNVGHRNRRGYTFRCCKKCDNMRTKLYQRGSSVVQEDAAHEKAGG